LCEGGKGGIKKLTDLFLSSLYFLQFMLLEFMISEKMAKNLKTAQSFLENISNTLDKELEDDLSELRKLKIEVFYSY
jgi:hypothetical protein